MAEPNGAPEEHDRLLREAAESTADLERGELPVESRRRLAQETGDHPVYATGLSVNEFLLTRAAGYEPLGLVLGSSIYHVGWQTTWYQTGEMNVVTRAHLEARRLAMGRMEQEARALRAHGIVGVRLTMRDTGFAGDVLEFTATGTAVRLRGAPPAETPFMSDLSGDDFWTLLRSGYVPRGLVMGFCAYHVYWPNGPGGFSQNAEWGPYTAGVYQSRRLAMARLHDDIRRVGADGVAGVQVESEVHGEYESGSAQRRTLRATFLAIGTAISGGGRAVRPPPPLQMIDLRSRQ